MTRPVDIAAYPFKQDPHAFYPAMRAAGGVSEVRVGRRPAWLVTRYDDVARLLKDERFVKDRAKLPGGVPWVPAFARPLARNMLDVDEPDHRRLRGLVTQAFTPRIVAAIEGRVTELAGDLLDRAAQRRSVDLVRDYAAPIPTTIIAEILGVAPDAQREFAKWTQLIVVADASSVAMLRALPAVFAMVRYLRRLVAEKRERPGGDLTSALIAARDGDDQLGEDELLAMLFLLLVAGHETTANVIANGVLRLLEAPDQRIRLRADPTLAASAVEEILRFEGPLLTTTERFTTAPIDFAGMTIPAGATVYGALASANRDPEVFAEPDRLDIARSPNRHLSFGDGPHFCAGAALARMESRIALQAIVARFPGLALCPGAPPRWKGGAVLRGLQTLRVTIG